jgi:hypothetical protein
MSALRRCAGVCFFGGGKMVEPNGFDFSTLTDRIVTKQMIADLYLRGNPIRVLRSGVFGVLGHCGDCIRAVCKRSDEEKKFRYILPSLTNPDVRVRAAAAGKSPEEVLIRLADWHEGLVRLGAEIGPKHTLELRTTEEPHRYHAIISETEGFVGFAFHYTASLTTRSLDIGRDSEYRRWKYLGQFIEDFDKLWDASQPYQAGDNSKRIKRGGLKVRMNPILLRFGKATPSVIGALKFIQRGFPDANGNGATAEQLSEHTGADPSDCNKRLVEMGEAGFLYKLGGSGGAREFHGRLLTSFGGQILEEWEKTHGREDLSP